MIRFRRRSPRWIKHEVSWREPTITTHLYSLFWNERVSFSLQNKFNILLSDITINTSCRWYIKARLSRLEGRLWSPEVVPAQQCSTTLCSWVAVKQKEKSECLLACSRLFHSISFNTLSTYYVLPLVWPLVFSLPKITTSTSTTNSNGSISSLTLFSLPHALFFLQSLTTHYDQYNGTCLGRRYIRFTTHCLPLYQGKKQWHLVDKPLLCLGRPVVPTMPLVSRFARCFPSFTNMSFFCTPFELSRTTTCCADSSSELKRKLLAARLRLQLLLLLENPACNTFRVDCCQCAVYIWLMYIGLLLYK